MSFLVQSSNNGIIIPDELGQLLPVEDTRFGEYEIVEHEDYNELKGTNSHGILRTGSKPATGNSCIAHLCRLYCLMV